MSGPTTALREGLTRVLSDVPLRKGYLSAMLLADEEAYGGRVEVGYKPRTNVSLYGFGEWNSLTGRSAGAGVQLDF